MTSKLKSSNWDKNNQENAALFLSTSALCLMDLCLLYFSILCDVIKLPISAGSGAAPSAVLRIGFVHIKVPFSWWSLSSVHLEALTVRNQGLIKVIDHKQTDVADTSIYNQDLDYNINKLKSGKKRPL